MTAFDVTKHAQDCAAFIELRRIADWVGDGKPVTSKGVLRPADLRRASAETGIPIPERFRSAGDVPRWNRLWTAALSVGVISLEGGVVKAEPPLEITPELWLRAFVAALAANFGDDVGTGALNIGRAALTALAAARLETFDELDHYVWQQLSSDLDHDYWRLRSAAGYENSAALLAEILVGFGAVTEQRKLTELGRWALGQLIRGGDDIMSAEPHVPPDRICQLKITLAGVGCWRRVLIHSDASLGDLHWVIQAAMRWDDDHLHGFTVGSLRYGDPGYDMSDEDEIAIGEAFTRTRQRIGYTYDFGDDWRHDIDLERVLDVDLSLTYPVCVAGRGAVPVEDTHFRVIQFDQADINRRLSGTPVEKEQSPLDAVIETILGSGWHDDEFEAFVEALEIELEFPAKATANGKPVTVVEVSHDPERVHPPFALCRSALVSKVWKLADIRFPAETGAAWLHAAYRHYLGLEPFPAEPRPDWNWPENNSAVRS